MNLTSLSITKRQTNKFDCWNIIFIVQKYDNRDTKFSVLLEVRNYSMMTPNRTNCQIVRRKNVDKLAK